VKSPLILGLDVSKMSAEILAMISNSEVIGVNQDSLGIQGRYITQINDVSVWAGPLSNDAHAVVIVNTNGASATPSTAFTRAGLNGTQYHVRDLWAHKDLGIFKAFPSVTLRTHACVMYILTPVENSTDLSVFEQLEEEAKDIVEEVAEAWRRRGATVSEE
jgi:alpha-galactosidase